MAAKMRDWSDYFYPETINPRTGQGVLRNNFGERDPKKLRQKEEAVTVARLEELHQHPIEPAGGRFDFEHMKALHRHIFQDVYAWAGEPRTAPWLDQMTKTGPNVLGGTEPIAYGYYPASGIEDAARDEYRRLAGNDYLAGRDRESFVAGLADHWNEINVIHAFREGNTRSQSAFFTQLADHAGFHLDISRLQVSTPLRDEFVNARFFGQATGHPERLADVLNRITAPKAQAPAQADPSRVAEAARAAGMSVDEYRDVTARLNRTHPDSIPGPQGAGESPRTSHTRDTGTSTGQERGL